LTAVVKSNRVLFRILSRISDSRLRSRSAKLISLQESEDIAFNSWMAMCWHVASASATRHSHRQVHLEQGQVSHAGTSSEIRRDKFGKSNRHFCIHLCTRGSINNCDASTHHMSHLLLYIGDLYMRVADVSARMTVEEPATILHPWPRACAVYCGRTRHFNHTQCPSNLWMHPLHRRQPSPLPSLPTPTAHAPQATADAALLHDTAYKQYQQNASKLSWVQSAADRSRNDDRYSATTQHHQRFRSEATTSITAYDCSQLCFAKRKRNRNVNQSTWNVMIIETKLISQRKWLHKMFYKLAFLCFYLLTLWQRTAADYDTSD